MLLNLPFTLPGWMPSWLFLLLVLPALLWALAFLLMPFSVFGLKARLEALEEQIASLHEDLRVMTLRASGGLPPAPPEFHAPEFHAPEFHAPEFHAYDEVPAFSRIKRAPVVHEEPMMPPPRPAQPAPRPVQPPPPPVQPTPRPVQPLSARERLSPTPAPAPAPKPFRRTEPRLD